MDNFTFRENAWEKMKTQDGLETTILDIFVSSSRDHLAIREESEVTTQVDTTKITPSPNQEELAPHNSFTTILTKNGNYFGRIQQDDERVIIHDPYKVPEGITNPQEIAQGYLKNILTNTPSRILFYKKNISLEDAEKESQWVQTYLISGQNAMREAVGIILYNQLSKINEFNDNEGEEEEKKKVDLEAVIAQEKKRRKASVETLQAQVRKLENDYKKLKRLVDLLRYQVDTQEMASVNREYKKDLIPEPMIYNKGDKW